MSEMCCASPAATRSFCRPKVQVFETQDAVEILAEVPGADQSSTDLAIENDTLTLTARVASPAGDVQQMLYSEISGRDYRRVFRLSDNVDRQRIEARVKDGILRIRLPKAEHAVPRKIAITAG